MPGGWHHETLFVLLIIFFAYFYTAVQFNPVDVADNMRKFGGFIPGIYVGANCILSGNQLYSDLKFQHYWKSLSNVPTIPNRGYQLIQSKGATVYGVNIDNDTTQNDEQGDSMIWLKIG